MSLFNTKKINIKNKKALENTLLVKLLIGIFSILALSYVAYLLFGSVNDIDQELKMTRNSVLLSDKFKIDKLGHEFARSPIYLKTHSIEIPERGYSSSKEDVMKNIADRIADTWWAFGEGKIDSDALGRLDLTFGKDKCFIQFNITIKELDKEFAFYELLNYLIKRPYKAKAKRFEYCKEPRDPPGCIPKSTSECMAKGGQCASDIDSIDSQKSSEQKCREKGLYPYSEWKCKKSNDLCCVPRENMMTYYEYLEEGNGVLYTPNLGADYTIKKGNSFSIIFKDSSSGDTWEMIKSIYSRINIVPLMYISILSSLYNEVSNERTNLKKVITAIGNAAGEKRKEITTNYVGTMIELTRIISDFYPLQGIMFVPNPPSDYGNCALVDET